LETFYGQNLYKGKGDMNDKNCPFKVLPRLLTKRLQVIAENTEPEE
jgi:hypothetical protein